MAYKYTSTNRLTGFAIIVIFILQWIIISPPATYACSCLVQPPPKEALELATAVFSGKVTAIEANEESATGSPNRNRITLAIDRVWKGKAGNTVVVTTAHSSAACGFHFESGHQYLVYAHGSTNDLNVSLCSRTAEFTPDLEDMAALGPGTSTQPGPSAGGMVAYGVPISTIFLFLVALAILIVLVTVLALLRRDTR